MVTKNIAVIDAPAVTIGIQQIRPEDGSIILMHDEYETSVEAAFLLIDRLKKTGYEFVTVDKLISDCAGGSL